MRPRKFYSLLEPVQSQKCYILYIVYDRVYIIMNRTVYDTVYSKVYNTVYIIFYNTVYNKVYKTM